MTLNRMYHCVPRIISGDSQMSGLSCQATMHEHRQREQQVRRERREELRDRLHDPRELRAQADTDADRHPDQRWRSRSARSTRSMVMTPRPDSAADVRLDRDATPAHRRRSARQRKHDQRRQEPYQTDIHAALAAAGAGARSGRCALRRRERGGPVQQTRMERAVALDAAASAAIRSAPRIGSSSPCFLVEAEAVGPGHQRAEQQLVVDQDHDQHRARSPSRSRARLRCAIASAM